MILLLFGLASVVPALADESALSRKEMRSLDEQVQAIKSDVMDIAAELSQLEEKLIYPSNTQVAVFVSLADAEAPRLDSLKIQIDGAPVSYHVYSFGELEALKKGGVQRAYTGNLETGEHVIEVSLAGALRGGSGFEAVERFTVTKGIGPKLLGLTVATKATGGAHIELGSF